jgi:hypothetical protein
MSQSQVCAVKPAVQQDLLEQNVKQTSTNASARHAKTGPPVSMESIRIRASAQSEELDRNA